MTYFEQFPFIKQDMNAKTLSFAFMENHCSRVLDDNLLKELTRAGLAENSIVRICLHTNSSDKLQTMVLFLPKGGGYALHMHPEKSESYQIIQGKVSLGDINGGQSLLSSENHLVYMPAGTWHSITAIDGYAIFTENRQGPFTKGDTSETIWHNQTEDKS